MSLAAMPSSYKKTFNHYIKLFKCIGIEFFDDSPSYFTWKNLKLAIFFCTFVPFVIGQFSLISEIKAENFLESVRVVPVDIMFLLDIVKLSIAIVKRTQIKDMFVEIGELWPQEVGCGHERYAILRSYLRRIRLPLDLFLIYGYVNLAIFEVIPLIISSYYICTGAEVYVHAFQPTNSWAHENSLTYFVTYLWQMTCTIPCQICLYLPFDLTMSTMALNISTLLRLLQEDLKNSINVYDEDKKPKKRIHVSNPESYERVKNIVQVHQRLLRLADKLNDIFGVVILIHVAFASVEICFFGFLTVVYGGLAETIANLLTVMSAVFTIFILSLSGQTLCDTSTDVANAAYQSLWYESDKNVRKYILFMIIRAQRPSYLSALGFSQLTLASFSKIMSSSWTYFSLLIQLYEET